MQPDDVMGRRALLRTGAGLAAATATGTAAAQDDTPTGTPTTTAGGTPTATPTPGGSGGEVDYGGWFENTSNFDGTMDMRGQSEVTVEVGAQGNGDAFAFAPAAIRVDPGTTVVWEWTGEGGGHNVQAENDAYVSEIKQEGSYAVQFDGSGVSTYFCLPHQSAGMNGAVVVGDADGTTDATPETAVVQTTPTPGGEGGATETGPDLGLPPNIELYGVALVIAVLSPILFAIILGLSYDPEEE
jgi:halocyanin-like protein